MTLFRTIKFQPWITDARFKLISAEAANLKCL